MSWTYSEALAFLADEKREIHLQLDRMEALLRQLGSPEKDLAYIHIAGTNGKGSILAYLGAALSGAGLRVGSYSSPVVYFYREQFRINGEAISEEEFTALACVIRDAVDALAREGVARPSSFELETCLAILYFRAHNCDLAIMECGMGGRDDATNVIPAPVAAVFASIGMDHEQYLGHSIEEITAVKAGILKPGCGAAISGPQTCSEILRARCAEAGIRFRLWREEDIEEVALLPDRTEVSYRGIRLVSPLVGAAQVPNLLTAYETLKYLQERWEGMKHSSAFPKERGFSITEEQILDGIARAHWPGRMTRISDDPVFYVDGAHNPAAAKMLAKTLRTAFPDDKWIFLVGVFRDKDVSGILREMRGIAGKVFAVAAPGNQRALPPEEIAALWRETGEEAEACGTLQEAVKKALAEAGGGGKILAFGSLAYLSEVEKCLQIQLADAGGLV